MGLLLSLYGTTWNLLLPLLLPKLRKGHEIGFEERLGRYDREKLARMKSGALWVHAVSVGETQAAAPFVAAARRDWQGPIIVSTVTKTGAENAGLLMKDAMTAHIYAPWDAPRIAARAFDAIAPQAYVTVETEIWPNILAELKRRGVPRMLLNARVSDRAWRRTGLVRTLLREAYSLFDLAAARSEEDARRLLGLGMPQSSVHMVGDCKIDAILTRRESARPRLAEWRQKLAVPEDAPLFVAGSTHEGEEEVVLQAFQRVRATYPQSRLILAPRHPERAGAVAELANGSLLSDPRGEIFVVDRIGVLYELYGLAAAAFIGGSLIPRGGQNIVEPASWNVPIEHGPHMEDFAEVTAELDSSGAATEVCDAEGLAQAWLQAASRQRASGPAEFLAERRGAAERAWSLLKTYLAQEH